MRFPFVSRDTLDRISALYEARLADKDAELTRLRPIVVEPKPLPIPAKREPSKVENAIQMAAGENRQLKRYLQAYAVKAKADGLDEDTIALKILNGDRVDDDTAVEE